MFRKYYSRRAKEMGFDIEYLSDGTVKGVLNLKAEDLENQCPPTPKMQEPSEVKEQQKTVTKEKQETKQEASEVASA
jgi:hypothetical protein